MKQRMLQKITNTIQYFIQEIKTKVTKISLERGYLGVNPI